MYVTNNIYFMFYIKGRGDFNEKYIHYLPSTKEQDIIDLLSMDLYWKNVEISSENDSYIKTPEFKELSQFLRKNELSVIKLFHGTSEKYDVTNDGLKTTKIRTKKSLQSGVGYVYLSVYPDMAGSFGDIANPYGDIVVYQVLVPISELKPDKDQLYNLRNTGRSVGESLVESLVLGHGACIKGDIPPYMIDVHKKIKRPR